MFRVVLDLSYFFYNHKRKARVFIKDNIKTVADLQRRIKEIFGVNNFELYALDGQCFLPSQEDIRVLKDDEVVSVIPLDKNEPQRTAPVEDIAPLPEKIQKNKRSLEIITEENSGDCSSPKKKKSKEKEGLFKSFDDELPKRKKKKKHTELESPDNQKECESSNSVEKTKNHKKMKTNKNINLNSLLPTLKSHINSCDNTGRVSHSAASSSTAVRLSNHVDTPFKKFKKLVPIPTITNEVLNQKKINIVKIDIIKSSEEVNIGKNDGNSTNIPLESLMFSTPKNNMIKKIVHHIDKEKSISPENIDAMRTSGISSVNASTCNDIMEVEQETSPKKSFISEHLNAGLNLESSLGENINNENNTRDKQQSENFEHTRTSVWSMSLDNTDKSIEGINSNINSVNCSQSETDTKKDKKSVSFYIENTNVQENLHQSTSEEKTNSSKNESNVSDISITSKQIKKSLDNVSNDSYQPYSTENSMASIYTDKSFNNNSSDIAHTPPSTNSKEDPRNSHTPSEVKNFFFMKRKLAGVAACLGQLRESSDNVNPAEPEGSNFVTKRQRKRVRRHRSKRSRDNSEASTSDTSFVETYVPKPMNVSACPKIHVRFNDDDEHDPIDVKNSEPTITEQKIEENSKAEFKPEETAPKESKKAELPAPFLSEDTIIKCPIIFNQPKEGDVIAFKILTMKNLSPVISNYIVGRVLKLLDDNIVQFEILSQNADFENDEEQGNTNLKEFHWAKLIAPRHIFP